MKLKNISNEYVKEHNNYYESKEKIENQIEQIEKKKERLEKKKEKLEDKFPSWIDMLIKPIAEELCNMQDNMYYDILGPFGISAETSIHFYPNGQTSTESISKHTCKSITFIPLDLKNGEIGIRNYNEDTKQFQKGTIGEINGMNHPTIKLSSDIEIKELIKYMRK